MQRGWSMPWIGGRGRARAGRDHGVLEADVLAALDRERVGAGEAAAALDDLDAVGLQQPGEALHDAVDDAAACWPAPASKSISTLPTLHAELCERAVCVVDGVGALHHRLRRDAADVQAGAADGAPAR